MLKMKKLLLGLPALAVVLSVATITVYAHDAPKHDEATAQTATTSQERQKPEDASSVPQSNTSKEAPDGELATQKRLEMERGARAKEDAFRKNGDDLIAQLKAEHKELRTAEQRQKACENRKKGMETRFDSLDRNAQKHQKRLDEVFAKIVAYQKDKNLTIDNFDTLVAAATAAQSKSAVSVQALTALKPALDCSKEQVASDVAAFKAAVAQARTDLSAYKKTVKDLLKAAEAAKKQGA